VPHRSDAAAGRPALSGASLPIDERFDVAFANEIARLESYNKHHYRPNTYMHKWWARRCGSTFRLILKHLVADEARQDYYTPGGLEGRVVLDPMMGGGTTLHEALRLGASVVGGDIDPIPVLQARATLSAASLPALEKGFAALMAALQERLAAINEEMSALRAQQKVILEMLGPEGLSADTHVVTREQWVSFLRIAGLDEEGMRRWHIAFESSSPKAHKDFLESLGLDSDEIRRIRLWKR